MKKIYKVGVHTFYRPRAWGDGEDEPVSGDPVETAKEAANEEAKAQSATAANGCGRKRGRRRPAKTPANSAACRLCAEQMRRITNIRF